MQKNFHKYLFPSYTVPVKVQTQQPYQLRTYAWCWSIPPKCSRYKIQMKTVFKTEVNVLFVLYFLSATVCFDIGQRAERRGKTSSTLFRAKYPRLFVLYSGLVLCLIFQFRFQMIPKIRTVSECCRGFTRSSNGSSCVPICRWGNIFKKVISVYLLNNFHVPFCYNQGELCCSMEPFKISINLIDILDSNLEITTNVFSLPWKNLKGLKTLFILHHAIDHQAPSTNPHFFFIDISRPVAVNTKNICLLQNKLHHRIFLPVLAALCLNLNLIISIFQLKSASNLHL